MTTGSADAAREVDGNPGCPETQGPDHDFSASPLLATVGNRQILVIPQKSGIAHALDPDTGDLVWKYRFGQGSGLGGQWGATADGQNVYFGVGDGQSQNPGGIRAVKLTTGEQIWSCAWSESAAVRGTTTLQFVSGRSRHADSRRCDRGFARRRASRLFHCRRHRPLAI